MGGIPVSVHFRRNLPRCPCAEARNNNAGGRAGGGPAPTTLFISALPRPLSTSDPKMFFLELTSLLPAPGGDQGGHGTWGPAGPCLRPPVSQGPCCAEAFRLEGPAGLTDQRPPARSLQFVSSLQTLRRRARAPAPPLASARSATVPPRVPGPRSPGGRGSGSPWRLSQNVGDPVLLSSLVPTWLGG